MTVICTRLLVAALLVAPAWQSPADSQPGLDDAERVYRQQGPEAALPLFESLAAEHSASGDRQAEGRAIGYLGEVQWRLGNYPEAERLLERALDVQGAAGDRLQQGKSLNVLGLLYWDLGDYAQAQARFREGADIAAEVGDNRLAGAILNNLSLVHDELGDYYVSLDQYRQVLDLYATADFPRGEGDTLGNIGGVYLLLGRYQEALDHYQRALVISERLDSAISRSQDHGNVALAYLGLGQVDVALEHLDQAVSLAGGAGMRQDEAYWLGVKGNALMLKGRYDQGLEYHAAGLAIYRQLEGKTELVEALHDIGQLHLLLGDSVSAAALFREAMQIAREIGLARGVTVNLLALGDIERRQGDRESARALYAQAAQRSKESGEMALWVQSRLRQARIQREAGQFALAGNEAEQALAAAREMGAVGLELQAVFATAESERLANGPVPAIGQYEQLIRRLAATPDVELAWQAHYGLGLARADSGDLDGAIDALKVAITYIESVRDRLSQERFKAGFVQDKYQVYVDLVRLQLEAGREAEAFTTAERLRSRSYLDLIGEQPPGASAPRDRALEYALRERIRALREALAEEQDLSVHEQRQLAISVYSQELLAAEQAYQAFLDDRRDPGQGQNRHPPTYAEVRARLAEREALIEYVVGDEQVVAFVLTRAGMGSRTVPLRREDLDSKVELLRSLIRRHESARWEKPAASLARHLVEPILGGADLDDIEHLYLVPHGTLNYLPFGLLPGQGERRVIQDYTLAYLPTAAALIHDHPASRNDAPMLAVAPARARLKHASEEANTVNSLFGAGSKALIGRSATESAFKQAAANYRLLHLATHGYFNKFNPLLSGLELEPDGANDGQLELHEILGLQLDAELVTLSACQTGLGSGHFAEVPAGDDFVGLTRAFLYAGSSSVLATLWEVDDASTLDLMKKFYAGISGEAGINHAEALARAQRAFLASDRYRHPYYWAPFVLVGEMHAADPAKSEAVSVKVEQEPKT